MREASWVTSSNKLLACLTLLGNHSGEDPTHTELHCSSTSSPASFSSPQGVAPKSIPNTSLAYQSLPQGLLLGDQPATVASENIFISVLFGSFFLIFHSSLFFLLLCFSSLTSFLSPFNSYFTEIHSLSFPQAHGEMLILIFHFLLMDILHLPLLVVTVLFLEKKYSH